MKYIYFIFSISLTFATACTNDDIQRAKASYALASKENNTSMQVRHLREAIDACYSAEIEANLFVVQAQESKVLGEKVKYYKKSLRSISKFQDKSKRISEQNRINYMLSLLVKDSHPELSKIYVKKHIKIHKTQKDDKNIWTYFFLILLILWGIRKIWIFKTSSL